MYRVHANTGSLHDNDQLRIAICLVVRGEEPLDVLEFLAYHRCVRYTTRTANKWVEQV